VIMDIFDFNKLENFDEHIELSIPNYDKLFSLFVDLATIFSEGGTSVVDYGCSTGRLLRTLPKKEGCTYFGVDNSNLLPQSTEFFGDSINGVTFIKEDATKALDVGIPSVVVSMFFLQFLTQTKRKEMLRRFKEFVKNGSVLLVSEKVILDDPRIDNLLSRLHLNSKRSKFSDSEILDKDKQLLYTMFCKPKSVLLEELGEIGTVTQVWQSFNFMGFVVR